MPNLTDDKKIEIISQHFKAIMETLGLNLANDSLKDTPKRVAKMYVNELFSGLDPKNKPSPTLFENDFGYSKMLIERNISFYSVCEHHFAPIIGKAHVAYISTGKIIGLSKLNRVVRFFAAHPQVQERLTNQIGEEFQEILKTKDVAVVIEAQHLCVSMRGIKDVTSDTLTFFYGGRFDKEEGLRSELLNSLKI